MASPESQRIRAEMMANRSPAIPAPSSNWVQEGRDAWEASVEAVNRGVTARITPTELGGVQGEWVSDAPVTVGGPMILLFHGGGFNAGSARISRSFAERLLRASGVPVLTIDYRLAPEHPAPAALDDAEAVYRALRNQGWAPDKIVIGGESAGGGLAASLLHRLARSDSERPAAAFLLSPWLDLTLSGPSMTGNEDRDPMTSRAALARAADLYLRGGTIDARHPDLSPLFSRPEGFPPLLIHAGGLEVLKSDATRFAEATNAAGVEAELVVWDDLWHVFQMWSELPEAQAAVTQIGQFARDRLGLMSVPA